MWRPGQSTALARRTCLSLGMLNLGESKNLGSAQKRTVVPVLRWPTVPTTLRPEVLLPSAKRHVVLLAPGAAPTPRASRRGR